VTTPSPGVIYTYSPEQQAFIAPGRASLPIGAAGWTPPSTILVGSLPVGDAHYGVPDSGQVLFVSPSGSDSAAGTIGAPKKTLAGAHAAASTTFGRPTIVLREGVYHESLSITKSVKIQAYPGEEVWLDGSTQYTSWSGSGPYTATLGPNWSPISTTGFPLTSDPYGNLPEQVWIDGVAQKQIADGATPSAGQFSVNRSAHTITLGTSPSGKEVRVADLNNALTVSAQIELYGIGIRRYSPVVQEGLSALVYFGGTSQGSVVENCVFQDSGMVGINTARAITLRNITVQDCGNTGIQVTTANNFRMDRFVIRRCNRGLWRAQPHTAGIKVTRTEGLIAKDGLISDVPGAMGFWLDVSVTKSYALNISVDGATVMPGAPIMELGLHSELSDGGYYGGVQHYSWYVNCRVKNTKHAVKFLDAGYTNIANCKIESYASVGIYLQQDGRRNPGGRWEGINTQSGNTGDPYVVPWVGFGTGIYNNDIGQGGLQVIAYHDPPSGTPLMLGWDFIDRIEGNWFRPAPPGSMVQLGRADGSRSSYNTLAALAATPTAVGIRGTKLGTNHQSNSAPSDSVAIELPEEITNMLGVPRGIKRVGPILPEPTATF
jgi:hypothetical protein